MSEIRGEFWIDDDGQSMYADGDIGDIGHEGHVIQMVQSQYADDQFTQGEWVDWDEFKQSLAKEVFQEQYEEAAGNPQKQQNLKQEFEDDPEQFAIKGLRDNGMSDEEYAIAEGNGDAREFAMKNWGWKRLLHENVETWTLKSKDIQAIVSGLWDAYQEPAEKGRYNIYVYSMKKWFNDVPYDVLANSSHPGQLQSFSNLGMRAMESFSFKKWMLVNRFKAPLVHPSVCPS